MQMKKTLGILLAVCFLMSVTAAAVSAAPQKFDKKEDKKFDDKKIEKKVVKVLKVVKKHNGLMKLELIKYTLKINHHVKKVWFGTEWVFVPFHEDHGQDHGHGPK
jgi:hypothetical protein